jgi:hypothetical protein
LVQECDEATTPVVEASFELIYRNIDIILRRASGMTDEETDQARRQYMAATGEYRSMKQQKEAQKKGADLFDMFAKMIAERDGDE